MKQILLFISALSLFSSDAKAQRAPISITDSTGTYSDWNGFDWVAQGGAIIKNYDSSLLTPQTVNVTFWSQAIYSSDTSGNYLGAWPCTHEYTIVANMTLIFQNDGAGHIAETFQTGDYSVWYDTRQNSDLETGVGFTDGVKILSGTLIEEHAENSWGSAIYDRPNGGGQFTTRGTIDFVNSDYISVNGALPEYTTLSSTLQKGSSVRITQTGMPGDNGAGQSFPSSNYYVLQSDGNQSFVFNIPEPGSVSLLGVSVVISLLHFRRRK